MQTGEGKLFFTCFKTESITDLKYPTKKCTFVVFIYLLKVRRLKIYNKNFDHYYDRVKFLLLIYRSS